MTASTSNPTTQRSRPARRAAALVAGAVAAVSVIAPAPAAAATADSKYESAVATSINAERAERGITKTKWSGCLDSFAESQARKMAKNKTLKHQDLGPILRKCKFNLAGENIAVGYRSGSAVTAAWMKSSGHKANNLRKGYRLHGTGAYKDSSG